MRRGPLFSEVNLSQVPRPRLHYLFEEKNLTIGCSLGTRHSDQVVLLELSVEVRRLPPATARLLDMVLP